MSILVSIITIAASGVLASVVAHRLNATKEHVFFMRRKVEELYLALERYDRRLSAHFVGYYGVLKNEITYNDLLDLQNSRGKFNNDLDHSIETSIMLVSVYFPELKQRLNSYIDARDAIHEILADHKRAYKRGDIDGTRWVEPFHDSLLNLDHIAAELKEAILSEAVALKSAKYL